LNRARFDRGRMRLMRFHLRRARLMRFRWGGMCRARFDRCVMLLVRLNWSRTGLFRNMNWHWIVLWSFDRCIPLSATACGYVAILPRLLPVRDSGLMWLSPPGGLRGGLWLANLRLRFAFADCRLRRAVTEIPIVRRRRAMRIRGLPIIWLSCGNARISALPNHDQRIQWHRASCILLILDRRRRHRRLARMIGASEDKRLAAANRRFHA